ncbi:MAG: DUF2905 family protein [Planctomycetales bacterium]|nr:DUF2905 family protein [Planctomycetales bacterium]
MAQLRSQNVLPGDIRIDGETTTVYTPITTCVLLSPW